MRAGRGERGDRGGVLGGRVRRMLLVLVVVFLVVVVAVNVVSRRDGGGGDAGAGADAGPARTDVPDPPEALASPGSWVESRITESGDVEVRQWIRSPAPVERLQLTTADPDALPGTVEAQGVVVRDFDGTRLAARDSIGTRTLDVRLRSAATELYLAYTVAGETISSETSTVAGRTVARVTGMDVVFAGEDGPTTRVVTGPGTVLNAACLDPAAGYDAPPTPCGAATDDGGWQVELDGERRHDRILAQLEAG